MGLYIRLFHQSNKQQTEKIPSHVVLQREKLGNMLWDKWSDMEQFNEFRHCSVLEFLGMDDGIEVDADMNLQVRERLNLPLKYYLLDFLYARYEDPEFTMRFSLVGDVLRLQCNENQVYYAIVRAS